MATKLHEDWRELRRELGYFVNKIENMLGNATDIEELKKVAYDKGAKEALDKDKRDYCNPCEMRKFYESCNGYYNTIDMFLHLTPEDRSLVEQMIKSFSKLTKKRTTTYVGYHLPFD